MIDLTKPNCFRRLISRITIYLTILLIGSVGTTQENDLFSAHLKEVIQTFEEKHLLAPVKYEGDIARRTLDLYLDELDPERLFLTRGKVQQWQRDRASRNVEELLDRDLNMAHQIQSEFQQIALAKLKEADEWIQTADYSFRSDVIWKSRYCAPSWATSNKELQALWNRKLEADFLDLALQDIAEQARDLKAPIPEVKVLQPHRDRLRARYQRLANQISEQTNEQISEKWIRLVTQSFDPYSNYYSPNRLAKFKLSSTTKIQGIGAILGRHAGQIEVVGRIRRASMATLQSRDCVIAIRPGKCVGKIEPPQTCNEFLETRHLELRTIVDMIRGFRDTNVGLRVIPANAFDSSLDVQEIQVTRKIADSSDYEPHLELINRNTLAEEEVRIGWLSIPSFYDFDKTETANLLIAQKWGKLRAQPDALIIDVRSSSGNIEQGRQFLQWLFGDNGPFFQVTPTSLASLESRGTSSNFNGNVAVVTNSRTSGAGVIVAAAIQDKERGLIIGEQTSDKATTQSYHPIGGKNRGERGAVWLSSHRYHRITGRDIQSVGVVPDVILPSLERPAKSDRDILFSLQPKQIHGLEFETFSNLGIPIKELQRLSANRISNRKEYQLINESFKKNRSEVSLNARNRIEKWRKGAASRITVRGNTDFQRDEAIRIVIDWLEIEKQKK